MSEVNLFAQQLDEAVASLCPIQSSHLYIGTGVSEYLETLLCNRLVLAQTHAINLAASPDEADMPRLIAEAIQASNADEAKTAVACLGLLDLPLPQLEQLFLQFNRPEQRVDAITFGLLNWGFWRQLVAQLRGEGAGYFDSLFPDEVKSTIGLSDLEAIADATGWAIELKKPLAQEEECEAGILVDLLNLAMQCDIPSDEAQANLLTPAWAVRLVRKHAMQSQYPLNIKAMTLKPQAGMVPVRIGHPFEALGSQPFVYASYQHGSLEIPAGTRPGVLILQRQLLQDNAQFAALERLAAKGWLLVMEMDDDPYNWDIFTNSDFFAFRACHAVICSTPALHDMFSQWNPYVFIQPNNLLNVPSWDHLATAKSKRSRQRIFFGALNRLEEWQSISSQVIDSLAKHNWLDHIEWIVVHEKAVFDSLPGHVAKQFAPTLPYSDYLNVLASCDVALLPLNDKPFNRYKSDIKMIECFAHGVQPVCSPVVYQHSTPFKEAIQWANTPKEWGDVLVKQFEQPSARQNRVLMGYDLVKNTRTLAQFAPLLANQMRDWLTNREALELERQKRVVAHRLKGSDQTAA